MSREDIQQASIPGTENEDSSHPRVEEEVQREQEQEGSSARQPSSEEPDSDFSRRITSIDRFNQVQK